MWSDCPAGPGGHPSLSRALPLLLTETEEGVPQLGLGALPAWAPVLVLPLPRRASLHKTPSLCLSSLPIKWGQSQHLPHGPVAKTGKVT